MRVLVTGAASGIGRATCLRLARDASRRAQCQIAAVDLGRSAALDWLVGELGSLGAKRCRFTGDMATPTRRPRGGRAVERFGGLDGVVSNAGINRPGPLVDYAVETGTGVRGEHAGDVAAREGRPRRAGGRAGRDRGGGLDVRRQRPRQSRPLWAEQGRGHHARAVLAQEFGRDGIRVNTVSPGMVRTGMTGRCTRTRDGGRARALVPLGRVARRKTWPTSSRSCSGPTRATSTVTISWSMAAHRQLPGPPARHRADHEKFSRLSGG